MQMNKSCGHIASAWLFYSAMYHPNIENRVLNSLQFTEEFVSSLPDISVVDTVQEPPRNSISPITVETWNLLGIVKEFACMVSILSFHFNPLELSC